MAAANDFQIGGDHYRGVCESSDFQPWDFIIKHQLGYLQGNIVKYAFRHYVKRRPDDLAKGLHYAEKWLETAPLDAEPETLPDGLERDMERLGLPVQNDPYKAVISHVVEADPLGARAALEALGAY